MSVVISYDCKIVNFDFIRKNEAMDSRIIPVLQLNQAYYGNEAIVHPSVDM